MRTSPSRLLPLFLLLAVFGALLTLGGCDSGGPEGPGADTTPPEVQITSPQGGMAMDADTVTVRGTATDDRGVPRMAYRLGEGAEQTLDVTPGKRVTFEFAVAPEGDGQDLIVQAYDEAGNRGEARTVLTRKHPPTAAFTTGSTGEATTFDASASTDPQGDALHYAWDFGDGGRGGGAKVAHLYTEGGSFTVTLTVTNEAGLSDAATRTLDVAAPPPATGTATLTGTVTDAAGAPLPGVQAALVDGSASGTTDDEGVVEIGGFPVGAAAVLELSKSGYAGQFVRLEIPDGVTEALFQASLRPRNEAQTLTDVQDGGAVTDEDGVKITLPAGALIDASGAPVTGDVQVALTPVDVSGEEIGAFPGSFTGITTGGEAKLLLSYGVAEFMLMQNGEELQLAAGKAATIEIPVYTEGASAGDPGPLWSLDETTGVWIREGTGTVVASSGSPTGLALRAEIAHLSWWNHDDFVRDPYRVRPKCKTRNENGLPTLDIPVGGSCYIEGYVIGPDGSPWSGPQSRPTITIDAGGSFEILLPGNQDVLLLAHGGNGTLRGEETVNGPPGQPADVTIVLEPIGEPDSDVLELGVPVTATLQTAGEVDRYRFDGSRCNRVEFGVSPGGNSDLEARSRSLTRAAPRSAV